MKKRAFTLAEMVITLMVIGVVAVIMLPNLKHFLPNQEQVMLKKAYHLAGRVVNEMVNDDEMYPNNPYSDTAQYFAYATPVKIKGKYYPNYEPTDYETDKTNPENGRKFCLLFAQSMNITTDLDCSAHTAMTDGVPVADGNYTFKTTDGMVWQLPITDFGGESASEDDYYNIVVDVNGEKGGNCFEGAANCNKPDRFILQVNNVGRFTVPGSIAQEYLNRNDTTKKYADIRDEQEDAVAGNDKGIIPYKSLLTAVANVSPQSYTTYNNCTTGDGEGGTGGVTGGTGGTGTGGTTLNPSDKPIAFPGVVPGQPYTGSGNGGSGKIDPGTGKVNPGGTTTMPIGGGLNWFNH